MDPSTSVLKKKKKSHKRRHRSHQVGNGVTDFALDLFLKKIGLGDIDGKQMIKGLKELGLDPKKIAISRAIYVDDVAKNFKINGKNIDAILEKGLSPGEVAAFIKSLGIQPDNLVDILDAPQIAQFIDINKLLNSFGSSASNIVRYGLPDLGNQLQNTWGIDAKKLWKVLQGKKINLLGPYTSGQLDAIIKDVLGGSKDLRIIQTRGLTMNDIVKVRENLGITDPKKLDTMVKKLNIPIPIDFNKVFTQGVKPVELQEMATQAANAVTEKYTQPQPSGEGGDNEKEGETSETGENKKEGEGGQEGSEKGDSKKIGLMAAFDILYLLYAVVGAILVAFIFILNTIDIVKYSIQEVVQYIVLFINPNLFNKESLDFSTLFYYRNNEQEEPYSIYLQQQFVGLMFKILYYFIYTVILQIFVYVLLYFLRYLRGGDFNEGIDFKKTSKAMGILAIVVACAYVQNTYYNVSFMKSLQPYLRSGVDDIKSMKDSIYDNISSNDEFLESVTTENVKKSVNLINQQTNLQTISRMIFTLSVYNFFKINVSENAPEFGTIRNIFTVREQRARGINPVDYMYFGQNAFIPNLYPILTQYISGPGMVLDTQQKQDTVREDVARRITNLNKALLGLFQVPKRRNSFRNYLYISWMLTFAFAVMIAGFFKEELAVIQERFLIPYWNGLQEFFWTVVMPWDFRSGKKE